MMKKSIGIMLTWLLLFSCLFGVTAQASSLEEIQKQQEETQNAINDANKKKQEAEEEASAIEEEKNAIQSDYNSAYRQLSVVSEKIAVANDSIASTQSEIDALEKELEEAKTSEEEQYEAMKKRMVYFYENNSHMNLLVSFLTSGSLSEFINRATMISEIMTYDRQLLESYQELQTVIASKSKELEKKAEELSGYQASLQESQEEMDGLVSTLSGNLTAKSDELSQAESEVAQYEATIATLQEKMIGLQSQAAQAQADAAKAIADQLIQEQASGTIEDTSGSVSASDSDLMMLAATIQAEADNQSYEGKLAVGSVIMNRVKSSKFPNSISGVITQNKQFASYSSGMVTAIMAKGPNETCLSVANEVIAGKRNGNWLFFMTKPYADKFGITGYTQIGDHVFFLIWGANDTSANQTTQETQSEESASGDSSENTGDVGAETGVDNSSVE